MVFYRDKNKIKIIIEDFNGDSLKKFLNILEENFLFEVNFLNIQTIPKIVILRLHELKEKISIFTNESTLKNYLINLGFDLKFKNDYQTQNKNFIDYDLEFFTFKDLRKFLIKIYKTYGYDYTAYNLDYIRRRVKLFYGALAPNDFKKFEKIVLNNKSIFKDLFLNISINITTFFRNPEIFKLLRNKILVKLDDFSDIKIWCAGCSSGEEPYSVAILLRELGLLDKSLIYATDINEVAIENAHNGIYSKKDYHGFLKHYYRSGGEKNFSKYFNKYDNFVEIKDELKERILFLKHNLVLDGKINNFHLIFCRNVMMYFNKQLKTKILELFRHSLDNYGFLLLGEGETLDTNKNYQAIDKKNKIYKRKL